MANIDGLIFVDTNQYLDLYRMDAAKKLLAALKEQQNHIFVTAHIVKEVQRRKVEVAAAHLKGQLRALDPCDFPVPDHLFTTTGQRTQGRRIRDRLGVTNKEIKAARKELMTLTHDLLRQISLSEDGVSKALADIFAKAVPHSDDELCRARDRKELGNPPGKRGDPLGDQLSWEQILSHCKGKSRLWIITKDGDYATNYDGELFLNAALHRELAELRLPAPEVFCFANILEAMKHFARTFHLKAVKLPTLEETEQIKEEQESLPPLGWLTSGDAASNAAILNAHRRGAVILMPGAGALTVMGATPLLSDTLGVSLGEKASVEKRYVVTSAHDDPAN